MLRLLNALPVALALTALGAVALFTVNCGSSNQAQVRFVHAIQDAGPLDIDFNGTKKITDVTFFTLQPTTGYAAVPAGSDTIEGFQSGSTTTVAFTVSNVSLNSGSPYTVVATGFDTGNQGSNVILLTPTDTNTAPANGSVNWRVIDASPSGPTSVDVYILNSPFIGGLGCSQGNCPTLTISSPVQSASGAVSSYKTLSYNSGGGGEVLYVCAAGTTNPIISGYPLANVGGASVGSIRTLILTDQQNGTQMNAQPIVLSDLN